MLPVKKILCPTDFSDSSTEALRVAGELALHFSAELTLLHVVSTMPLVPASPALTGFHLPSVIKDMKTAADTSLDQMIQEKMPEGVKSRRMVTEGNPSDEIARIASDESMDMIVIATHGLGGWRQFIFGSVAEKVIKTATCPVLSIQVFPENKEKT